ncbi:MAG: hypothetical protein JWO09_3206 [Bacteroidetes bacterium]|nr:hypothetical protein [Bacteroidota bacterium]
MTKIKIFAFLLIELSFLNHATSQIQSRKPFQSTITYELMCMDTILYPNNKEQIALCKQLIDKAVERINKQYSPLSVKNASLADAIRIFKMIDSTFTEFDFLYYTNSDVHFNFLTSAFKERTFDPEKYILFNEQREYYWKDKLQRKCRLIDCDLYAEIYLGIAQVADLPINIGELPEHNYLRWNFPTGEYFCWDPNEGKEHYNEKDMLHYSWIKDGKYNNTLYPNYWNNNKIKVYYNFLLAYTLNFEKEFLNLQNAKLKYEECIRFDTQDPQVYNCYVWLFIMHPEFDSELDIGKLFKYIDKAIELEENFNFYDAKACLYAINNDFKNAIKFGELARDTKTGTSIRRGKADKHLDCFKRNDSCRELVD